MFQQNIFKSVAYFSSPNSAFFWSGKIFELKLLPQFKFGEIGSVQDEAMQSASLAAGGVYSYMASAGGSGRCTQYCQKSGKRGLKGIMACSVYIFGYHSKAGSMKLPHTLNSGNLRCRILTLLH